MEIPVTQLPPGDPRLVEAIVGQLKSKGIFDQFRKECLADVDTKPAFQNLRQRVEGHVNKFLEKKTWKNDMNKNQLRDGVRKHVNNLGILDSGIDAIITQVVNPKIKPLILPYVEDTVYAFLQIDKPKRERKTSEPHISPVFQEEEQQQHQQQPKPKPLEPVEEKKPSLLPMETDVISSEEDDILARESPDAAGSKSSSSSEEEEVKTIDENAQDGFEACPPSQEDTADAIASTVERLQLSEDDSKSTQAAKQPPPLPLFEDQSLDSISSNSSGLSFSPLTVKGSPDSKKSNEDATKSDQSPRMEVRSATSTPLVDEKPVDDNSQSSLELDHPKEFQPSEKMYAGDGVVQDREISDPSLSAVHSTVRPGKDGTSLMSFDEDSLESKESSKISTASGKSEVEEKPKFEKSEGEVTSSSSDLSDGDTKGKQELLPSEGRQQQQQQHSDHDSSHKSSSRSKSDHKKRRDSHSRDRDREREKEKDSRHHREKERKHSKSRDDHHSHRDKDKKHHRRDKDHDGDRERSRSHHHQSSSSSHKESSGSKDKERSSHHSSGKSSEGKSRSSHSSDKSEGKPSNKMESKSDEKSETKAHKKDDKRQQSVDRKSDSKSDRSREKLSEERTDKKCNKPDKKAEKKARSDDKHNKKSDGKSDSQDSKLEGRLEEKNIRTKEETELKLENKGRASKSGDDSYSKQKKSESDINLDSKRRRRNHKRKGDDSGALHIDSPEEKNGEVEISWPESKKNGVFETIGKECAIDPQVLGLNGDKIIVEDGEGNFLLVTYEDDTDSTSCDSQMPGKGVVSSSLEALPDSVEANSDGFVGFEAVKTDVKLFEYLSNVVRVPDDMDLECSEWFDESDLHMTIYEGAWEGKVPMNDFLRGLHQLGAVIRNEKGEVEDHSLSGLTPVTEDIKLDIKDNNNIQPLGKRRRISNSSSISSSSSSTGSPKHKRIRRESSAASDTSQMLEQDAVIVSGYALLTPEDDGNRSMSREYDLDYSQKIPNYSPLSPASDSSADERKIKNRVAVMDTRDDLVKPSVKIDQKTDTSWPSKEAKFSA